MCELVSKILIAKIDIRQRFSGCEAIEMAQKYGVTLIGFIREGRMNVYTHPARITDFSWLKRLTLWHHVIWDINTISKPGLIDP